jgi:hypothetical protein
VPGVEIMVNHGKRPICGGSRAGTRKYFVQFSSSAAVAHHSELTDIEKLLSKQSEMKTRFWYATVTLSAYSNTVSGEMVL